LKDGAADIYHRDAPPQVIAIVGGGISGLALAHYLRARGAECLVLESQPRPGGVIQTVDIEGLPLDMGPQRTRLTPEVRALITDVGLGDEVLTASGELSLLVFRKGRLSQAPLSLRQAFTTDLLTWTEKARVLLEPLTGGLREGETAGGFFRRKLGGGAYEALIAPLYGGLYASDPDRMPARHALATTLRDLGVKRSILWRALTARKGVSSAPPCSFRHGMSALPSALADGLGASLRTGCFVTGLRPRPEGGFVLALEDDDDVVADEVALCCPARAAAGLLKKTAPDAATRLEQIRYNPLAVVHLKGDEDLGGAGYQVALGEGLQTRGVTWNASLFGRPGLYTAFLGGMQNPDVVEEDDDRLGQIAADEFAHVTGCKVRVLHVGRTRIPAWDESWNALDGLRLPDGVYICANYAARPGIQGRLTDAKRLAVRLSPLGVGGARGSRQVRPR